MEDIVYHCIHKRFTENVKKTVDGTLNRKKAEFILTSIYHFPKRLSPVILKEMEILNLIKLNGKSEIEVLENQTDLENTSMLFKNVGLY